MSDDEATAQLGAAEPGALPRTGGPVAMPWAQFVWVLGLGPRRDLGDPDFRLRAMRSVYRWLDRWGRQTSSIALDRSLQFVAVEAALVVHFRAVVMVAEPLRAAVNAELNRRATSPEVTPHKQTLVAATPAEVAELTRPNAAPRRTH